MKLGRPSPCALFPPTIEGFLAIDEGLRICPNLLKTWWPGTELNRRRQPFQVFFEPKPFFNQQLNSSRWPIYCDHSVTSADVRLSVGVATAVHGSIDQSMHTSTLLRSEILMLYSE
jgi:hypothetical protein